MFEGSKSDYSSVLHGRWEKHMHGLHFLGPALSVIFDLPL